MEKNKRYSASPIRPILPNQLARHTASAITQTKVTPNPTFCFCFLFQRVFASCISNVTVRELLRLFEKERKEKKRKVKNSPTLTEPSFCSIPCVVS